MRRLLVLTVLLVTSVALPASATATSKGGAVLVAGPVTVRAYRMYLIASPATKKSRADLTVLFERRSRGEVQDHYYGFSRGVSVKFAADGNSARLLARLGAYGNIDLPFAPGPRFSFPTVCQGATVGQHFGSLTKRGGFDLQTHSSYFGEVRESRLPTYIATVRGGGRLQCKPTAATPARGVTILSSATALPDRSIASFTATHSARGHITVGVLVIGATSSSRAPAIIDSIQASALPSSDFSFAPDLSAAGARGPGPFLSESLNFTQTTATGPKSAIGTLAGNLTAHFDGLGAVQPAVSVPGASLSQG
jgi:hypothetical protein